MRTHSTNWGVMYSNGRGAPQDDKEAVKWFRLAAEQGEAFAQQRLDAILKSQAGTAETAPPASARRGQSPPPYRRPASG